MANLININKKFYISYHRGNIDTNILEGLELNSKKINKTNFTPKDAQYTCLTRLYKICSDSTFSVKDKNNTISNLYRILDVPEDAIIDRLFESSTEEKLSELKEDENSSKEEAAKARLAIEVKDALSKLIDFFTEFNFSPSYRFVNSMTIAKNTMSYVRNYFMVQDHPYATEIGEKIKSGEFKAIIKTMKKCSPKPINTRFELYFGDPGAGKTTKAMSITKKHISCRNVRTSC